MKLFFYIQKGVIEKGLDEISSDLINKVWNKEFQLLEPMVAAIKSNNKVKKMRFEDIQEIENFKPELNKEDSFSKSKEKNKDQTANNIEATKTKRIKISELNEDDVRKIVIEGKKNGKSEYEALKESGLIVTLEDILGDVI